MRPNKNNDTSNSQFSSSPTVRLTTPTLRLATPAGSVYSDTSRTEYIPTPTANPISVHQVASPNSNLSMGYQEQISQLGSVSSRDVDYKTISKHLVNQEDTLKLQGGDIARHLYHQIENTSTDGPSPGTLGASGIPTADFPKRRTRSSSFSTYLTETRRESTASDINVPGGFRREFIINKSLQRNEEPPNFLARNFMEFLSIYGHFAGEDFDDEIDDQLSDDTTDTESTASNYEDVFDEESSLLNDRRNNQFYHQTLAKQLPPHTPKVKSASPPKGTATVAKTFFLVFKSLVGSGVLFLPRAFFNGGLLFSTISLTAFGLLTFFCYLVLIKSKKIMGLNSFGELGFKTYGRPLKIFILFSIILSQIGFVATYILFTAENFLSFISQVLPGDNTPTYLTTGNIVLVQCLLLIPLVWIRNLTKLSMISLVSSIFIVVGLFIIFWYSGANLIENGIGPNITKFNPNSWSMLIGVAVTSFEGIGLVLPIESSMAEPHKFTMVLSVSMFLITVLFLSIGIVGYTSFGDQVKSIIILNLPQDQVAVQSILILYSVAVFLTAPLQLFPAIKIGESLIFNQGASKSKKSRNADNEGKLYQQSGKYNPQVKWLKNFFRAVSVSFICTIAYINSNNIDKFVSFNGCFACIPLVYIYPPLIHLRAVKTKSRMSTIDWWLSSFDYVLIVVGVVTVLYTTYQILVLN